jgi:hypothetical protein
VAQVRLTVQDGQQALELLSAAAILPDKALAYPAAWVAARL